MRIYLDVSCLNRPFDDQTQPRIRLEAEAIAVILSRMDEGWWEHLSSQMSEIEIEASRDADRKRHVRVLLEGSRSRVVLIDSIYQRAENLEALGFKPADAVHLAAAEAGEADVLLSCDDQMVNCARRSRLQVLVRVANPVDWLREQDHAPNA